MNYTIEYSKEADRTLRKWKKSNPQLFKKATKILLNGQIFILRGEHMYNMQGAMIQ